MRKNIYILMVCIVLCSILVSSAPPQQSQTGLYIRSGIEGYVMQNEDFDAHVHVYDFTTGVPVIEDVTCYLHLYDHDGTHLFEGVDSIPSHDFDYAWDIAGGNFSTIGTHQILLQCNSSTLGGFYSQEVLVNPYGEELTEGLSLAFNYGMIFLMILFVISLFGIFTVGDYKGKFAMYWVCHVLFIVGTFSVWQFNHGYGISYTGLAGIFKVLFYTSIFSAFPMLILSLAWIFYIHVVNDDIKGWMERGMEEGEATERARSKKRW